MVTGLIKINEYGERSFHTIHILQMIPRVHFRLGNWDPDNKIGYTRNLTQIEQETEDLSMNKTFIVSSILVSCIRNMRA